MEGSRDLGPLIKLLTVNLSKFTFSQCLEEEEEKCKKEELLRGEEPGENRGHGMDEEGPKGLA